VEIDDRGCHEKERGIKKTFQWKGVLTRNPPKHGQDPGGADQSIKYGGPNEPVEFVRQGGNETEETHRLGLGKQVNQKKCWKGWEEGYPRPLGGHRGGLVGNTASWGLN